MPARHKSLSDGLLLEGRFSCLKGSSRRKRVSARHQVKRLDRIFEGFALFEKPVRQKKQVFFVRCGVFVRNFAGPILKALE
jgi:hypothetical protein